MKSLGPVHVCLKKTINLNYLSERVQTNELIDLILLAV